MLEILFGIFLILHGLVHLIWFGISRGLIEGIQWTGKSWLLSNLFDTNTVKILGDIFYVIATILFLITGIAYIAQIDWRKSIILIAVIFSTMTILLFWDGIRKNLPDKGFIGILINIAIVIVVYIFDK